MTKIFTFLSFSLLLFSACSFNQSVNTDLSTGAYSRGNGIACDNINIIANGEIENRNTFIYGEKIDIAFNNIVGLNKENNKVFPKLSLYIVQNQKDTLLSESDLFSNYTDGVELSPLQLQANFVALFPHENNETYELFITIADKKGDGSFQYELPFTMVKNDLLTINSTNIRYKSLYLWNETKKLVVTKKEISSNDKYVLIIDGLEGFSAIDSLVFPIFSVEIKDNQDSQSIYNENLLSKYEESGINETSFKNNQLTAIFSFNQEGEIFNPYNFKAEIKDKNAPNGIKIETNLILD